MNQLLTIGYFIVGFLQLFAIQTYFSNVLDWSGIIAFFAALFVTYIPILGSILGVLGAHDSWGWDWLYAVLLFFWYVPFALIAGFSKN